jgi:deoxyribonuclease V
VVEATQPWRMPESGNVRAAGVFVVFRSGGTGAGHAGDTAWAAAAVIEPNGRVDSVVVVEKAGAPYVPGYLALREGPLCEAAVRALREQPQVLLVDATGQDHPRRAGLALHLGAVLDLPTVGVTDRPLIAGGEQPGPRRGDSAPLRIDGATVAMWVRSRSGVRPVVAHAAWRTDAETARTVVLRFTSVSRTPEPLRVARRLARTARSGGASPG